MTRERLLVSTVLAVAIHAVIFLFLQLFLKLESSRIPEYSGPLFVTLEEEPVIQKAEEPAPKQAEPSAVEATAVQPQPTRQAPTPQPTAAGTPTAGVKTPVAQAVPPAEKAPPTPKGSPLRMEGTPSQIEEPRPVRPVSGGEGFLTPSEQPALPPSGVKAQPVRPQAQADQPPLVPLEELDTALAQKAGGGSGTAAGTAGEAAAPGRVSSGTGTAATSKEGIPILWEDPSLGREPTFTPKPEIPKWVSEAGLRLQVVVSFVLTPQGILQNVKVEQGSGYSDVDSAVLEALRKWKFKPVNSTLNVKGRVPFSTYLIQPR